MLIEIVLLLSAIFLLYKLFIVNDKPSGTAPGPIGFPIIGSWPPRNMPFENYINSLRKKYGDTFWLKLGGQNIMFICEYEDILSAFSNPDLHGKPKFYSGRWLYSYGLKGTKLNHQSVQKGILGSDGPQWKNVRRFIIRRLRDGGMGKSSMEGIIATEVEALVEDFEKYVGKPTEIPYSINVSVLNVLWKFVGDVRYDIKEKEIHTLCDNLDGIIRIYQDKLFIYNMVPRIVDFLPEFILNLSGKKKLITLSGEIFQKMENMLEEHKVTLDEVNPRDLIDAYLIDIKNQQNDPQNKSAISVHFSELELLYVLFDLFIAGSETTSSTIKWFILFMIKYPEIQKKVQDEIDRAIAKDKNVTETNRERLPYLECCINETLRLKSILPFALFHVAMEDTTLGEFFIPKGTKLLASLICSHKSAKYFEKPNDFYPEHFLNSDNTFNNKKKGMLPFSTGKRVCVGENLARTDLLMVLGTLLQKFTFSAAEGEEYSVEPSARQPFFTVPKSYNLIINKRI